MNIMPEVELPKLPISEVLQMCINLQGFNEQFCIVKPL